MTAVRRRTTADVDAAAIASVLRSWYDAGHRALPWRETKDPYAIWISEVMLQQTQVAKVLPYYQRFLARFPSLHSLARAEETDVLKLWEGLGYYRRARHLLAAARELARLGAWPRTPKSLVALPGIGRSTAGAIASIAFGAPAPILDGNVRRVWSRVAALGPASPAHALDTLWAFSAAAVRGGDPGTTNQALMELGATLCTPRSPRCGECPIAGLCSAFKRGAPESYPQAATRRAKPSFDVSVAILWRRRAFLVSQRPADAMLGGLWELPGGKWEPGETGEAALRRELKEELGIAVDVLQAHPLVRHAYSHFSVRLHPYSCRIRPGQRPASDQPLRWIAPGDIPSLAFPTGTLKVFARVLPEEATRAAAEGPARYRS